ncbi:phage portal protein [Sphingomonas aracearum]|uniref:Phage portal protein n=1 Tax=Sphingomonas aracearum TaxID=2283317 RepID=A0A369VRM9_9SPHN|nr:phage portal protein [Sphingomonas aracearum]RDE05034.1 phage portal protein [Sphingomonas aracearum]
MKWFTKAARDGAGEGARPAPLSNYATGAGAGVRGDWPVGYEARVRGAYGENPVAQRSVRLIADALAGAPITASDPAMLKLVQARSGGQALLASVAAQVLLHGNAFVQVLRDAEGRPAELFALRPERVTVEPDARGWPAAYLYRVAGATLRLRAEGAQPDVVHVRSFHPLDDHYGLGVLGAAAGAVAVHNAAARWNKALLDNAARPSGALVYEPGDGSALSQDQVERLREELDRSFSGSGNAGRPMLLEGGLRWQALSLSPADMDFPALKAAAAREIACAFGVPPMLLGLPGDATYANYKEASRALWRLTVLPLADAIFAALAGGLAGWFDEPRLGIDLDRVTALAEDRERLWRQVSAADFLSAEEKRALLGLGEAA